MYVAVKGGETAILQSHRLLAEHAGLKQAAE